MFRLRAGAASWVVVAADRLVVLAAFALFAFAASDGRPIGAPLAVALFIFAAFQAAVGVWQYRRLCKPLSKVARAARAFEDGFAAGAWPEERDPSRRPDEVDRLINYVRARAENDYNSEMLRTQAEFRMLQSQINPHFLYNTLETIRSIALTQRADEVADMTEALASMFRYSISRSGDMATFAEEIADVESYLTIQKYRFPDKFDVRYIIEDERVKDERLPVLTIQPIVENAIHHGLETKLGKGAIIIRAERVGARLLISVKDDGSGIPKGRLSELRKALDDGAGRGVATDAARGKDVGIALVNVNKRLKFYFGAEYGLSIHSAEGVGTTVEIVLPTTRL